MTVIAKPMGPRVLVKTLEASEQRALGIVLPIEAMSSPSTMRGMIVEVGFGWAVGYDSVNEVDYRPLPLSVGDMVVWSAGCGIRLRLDVAESGVPEDFVVLHINEILLMLQERPSEVPVSS